MLKKILLFIKKIAAKKKIALILSLTCLIGSLIVLISLEKNAKNSGLIRSAQRINENLKLEHSNFMQSFERFMQYYSKGEIESATIEGLNEFYSFFVFEKDSLVFWSNNANELNDGLQHVDLKDTVLKLNNGFYLCNTKESNNKRFVGLLSIKFQYRYTNRFLKNYWNSNLIERDNSSIILLIPNNNNIYLNGKFLFALSNNENGQHANYNSFNLTLFYVLVALFIVLSLNSIRRIVLSHKNRGVINTLFVFILILLRLWQFNSKFPSVLYETKFFGPQYYATSDFLPSLGDFFINALLAFAIAMLLYYTFGIGKNKNGFSKMFYAVPFISLCFVIGAYSVQLIKGLIVNSSIVFSIENIFSLDILSYVGFSIIMLIFFSGIILTLSIVKRIRFNSLRVLLVSILVALVVFGFLNSFWIKSKLLFVIPLIIIIMVMLYREFLKKKLFNFPILLFYLFVLTFLSTLILNYYTNYKEKEYRKILALTLAKESDPVGESIFAETENKIRNDLVLKMLLQAYPQEQENITRRISSHFKGYWFKYDVFITLCDSSENIILKPSYQEMNCHAFFAQMLNENSGKTANADLFRLKNSAVRNSYLAIIDLSFDSVRYPRIFIELVQKFVPKDIGYPELLIDENAVRSYDIENYSYAKYYNNELYSNYGKYFYTINYPIDRKEISDYLFYQENGYQHMVHFVDEKNTIVISRKISSFIETVSPFSYLFLFYSIFTFIVFWLVYGMRFFKIRNLNLKSRIQLSIALIVVISFFIIGTGSIIYIYNIYNKKNYEIITEKLHSVLIELERELADRQTLTIETQEFLTDLLIKLQNVFFIDLNIYDLSGRLIASSNPRIFSEGIISKRMSPQVFAKMKHQKQFIYFFNEKIGDMRYVSAYAPFRNHHNKHIAYINLPYFAKQKDLQDEISSFLVTFINVYFMLIAFAIIIAFLISSYITKPLQMIKEKLSNIIYGKNNEKIEWNRQDELGGLIAEYNRMVDELLQSATMLAQSERESAWREMAKQVAHEIKNPLTPMKLNVQHIARAWNDKTPDFDQRLQRFEKSMIEQIETLARIAGEFSDFAKMPQTLSQTIDLIPLIHSAIDIYVQNESLQINFDCRECHSAMVNADKEQMLRVFNNLIKNAIQAKHDNQPCKINIQCRIDNEHYEIIFGDNGKGIPEDLQSRIFSPNFTTKSSGMGLGLAMVKNIITSVNGTIGFTSDTSSGTAFYIHLPKLAD